MTDRRVIRTNQALRSAFRKLAQQYRFHEITVQQLADEAGINRKTFYLHFDSIDDLTDSFTAEIADRLLGLLGQEPVLHRPLEHPGIWFDRLNAFFEEAPAFYTFILNSDDYSFMSRRVKSRVVAGLTTTFQAEYRLTEMDAKLAVTFLVDNTLTLFRLYLTGQLHLTVAAFKKRIVALNLEGVQGFLKVADAARLA